MSESNTLYSQLADLVALRFHVKQKKFSRKLNLPASGSGDHHSLRKGRGMTFSEVRQYQAGDDIRHIDWRVTARTQKPHTKVFIEEHERPTILVTEQTANLFFGSQVRLKSAQAANITALLAWVSLHDNERIGGLSFNDNKHHWVPPKHSQKQALQLLQQMLRLQQELTQPGLAQANTWPQMLKQLLRTAKPGYRVFVIGDMFSLAEQGQASLQKLSRHVEITAIHIYDSLEQDIPKLGWLSLTSNFISDQLMKLDTFNASTRNTYRDSYQNQWQNTKQTLGKYKIALYAVGTHEDPLKTLQQQKLIE